MEGKRKKETARKGKAWPINLHVPCPYIDHLLHKKTE